MTVSTIRPRRRRFRNTSKLLFIVPAAIVFAVVILLPIVENLFYSFTDWSGVGSEFS
ncbi:MAG: hypothetical protein JWN36_1513, partial [Microbacteriaceae bacterium]|nr:hypothetical protein [Microbacteriaceae bacterium]